MIKVIQVIMCKVDIDSAVNFDEEVSHSVADLGNMGEIKICFFKPRKLWK